MQPGDPGDLSDPGIEATSPALAGGVFTTERPGKLPAGTILYFLRCCTV